MSFRFINLLVIIAILLVSSTASGQVSVDPVGFAVAIEQDEELETEIILHNSGDEVVPYNVRIRKMNREDDRQVGPRRDEPGETIAEIELNYGYTVGLAWDAENQIMYASHCVDARIVGYQWNGEEILDVPVDFVAQNIPGSSLVGLAFFENVFYTYYWGLFAIYRYDLEGNQLESINTQWNDGLTHGLGLAVDPENAHLYMSAFHNAGEHSDIKIYDINDNFAEVGYIDGIENMGEVRDADVRNRLTWVPEHEDGHLWVYERNQAEVQEGAIGPDTPPYHAWQLDLIPGEEGLWEYEVITHFEVESDAWSNGIGHDGENLWIGSRNNNIVRIVDDGLSEAKWVTIEPRSGEIPANEDVALSVIISPVELEDGVYEQIVRISCADPAQTVVEMSVVLSLGTPTANISGTVTDAATGEPVEEVRCDLDYYFMSRWTSEDGSYRIDNLPMGEYIITFSHPDYLPGMVEVVIDEAGEVVVDAEMLHGEFNPEIEAIRETLAPDNDTHVALNVSNAGNAPVSYTSERRLIGDANADPWDLRQSFEVGALVEDNRLQGAVYVNDRFYVAGAHDQEPLIYVLNRDGELIDSYAQLGESRYGYKDLAWDGELIWGSGERTVFGFTPDGEAGPSFDTGISPCSNLAWDPDREILWASGTTTEILGFDRDGNQVEELDPQGLRMYGLAYFPDDPDGFQLYIYHKIANVGDQIVNKMNLENGEMMEVALLEPEAGGSAQGCQITNQFDIYSWVFLSVVNDGADDRIDIWQVDVRKDWFLINPTEGVIAANESQEFDLHLDATGLPPAEFEGEIVFSHDGFGSQTVIPVTLIVSEGPVRSVRTLDLDLGWNMVSVNVEPEEDDVIVMTSELVEAELLQLMKDGQGRFYTPEHNFNNIPFWNVADGYLIKMARAGELSLTGMSVLADRPIPLTDGWQMISYYPREPVDAVVALSGLGEILLLAKDGEGRFYNPEFRFSNMGDMVEGSGYMIKVSENIELVYRLEEELDGPAMGRPASVPQYLPVHLVTLENMSLLVLTDLAEGEIGVYAQGNLVGSGVIQNGRCGLAVWGDDPSTTELDGAQTGQALEFTFHDGVIERPVSFNLVSGDGTYHTDGFLAIRLQEAETLPVEFGIVGIYPNPFNSSTLISYNLPTAGLMSLTIYDLNGRQVDQLLNQSLPAGHHRVTWNAQSVPNGIYFCRLEAGAEVRSVKLTLVK